MLSQNVVFDSFIFWVNTIFVSCGGGGRIASPRISLATFGALPAGPGQLLGCRHFPVPSAKWKL